jgi:hypothetical protein
LPIERTRMNRLIPLFICMTAALVLPAAGVSQEKVYRQVPNDAVERVLQSLELKYQKDELKGKTGIMFFDFKRGNIEYRLYNYGHDLWIESTYERSMKSEDINRWNSEAKFSRLVIIEQKDRTTLSLEYQLDCVGGVTDAVIKQYINRFDEEAKRFAKFDAK